MPGDTIAPGHGDPISESDGDDELASLRRALHLLQSAVYDTEALRREKFENAAVILNEWDIDASCEEGVLRATVAPYSKSKSSHSLQSLRSLNTRRIDAARRCIQTLSSGSLLLTDAAGWLSVKDPNLHELPAGCARFSRRHDPDGIDFFPDCSFSIRVLKPGADTSTGVDIVPRLTFRRLKIAGLPTSAAVSLPVTCEASFTPIFQGNLTKEGETSMARELQLESFEKGVADARRRRIAGAAAFPSHDYNLLHDYNVQALESAYKDFLETWRLLGFECMEGTTTLNAKTHRWEFHPGAVPRVALTKPTAPTENSTGGHDQPKAGQADDTLRHEWVTVHKDSQFDRHGVIDISSSEGDRREQRGTEHEEVDDDGGWVVYPSTGDVGEN